MRHSPEQTYLENLAYKAKLRRQHNPRKYDDHPGEILERKNFVDETAAKRFQQYFYNWRKRVQKQSADRYWEAQHLQLRFTGPAQIAVLTCVPAMVKEAHMIKLREQFSAAISKLELPHGKK